MGAEIEQLPAYRSTIQRLEELKKLGSNGQEYWMARDIYHTLGYGSWHGFEAVIERARSAILQTGGNPSHHLKETSKLMGVGGGAKKRGDDYFLSRAGCRLIAMNGDPSKPEIAAAQAYFVVQTHRMEQHDALAADEKRLSLREKVSAAFKAVSGVAKDAGVRSHRQALFHDARYQGLYGMSGRDVKARKGLRQEDNTFDFAGRLELSAHEFQMNTAAEAIKKEGITGEERVIRTNKKIAEDVRRVMEQSGAPMPEDLPIEEPIKEVKKRVTQQKRQALAGPTDSNA